MIIEVSNSEYELKNLIKQGGTSSLYHGIEVKSKKRVLIEVGSYSGINNRIDFNFLLEKQKILLNQNYSLKILDFSIAQDSIYIVWEYFEGDVLSERLQKSNQGIEENEAVKITRKILTGLKFLHEKSIIHGDIKPENILIDTQGETKLMDFGISKLSQDKDKNKYHGQLIGSLDYLPPENIKGVPVNQSSDIYATGVILYEMLTNKKPFYGENIYELMKSKTTSKGLPPRKEIPEYLFKIILKAISSDPERRYKNASEFSTQLDKLQSTVTRKNKFFGYIKWMWDSLKDYFQLGKKVKKTVKVTLTIDTDYDSFSKSDAQEILNKITSRIELKEGISISEIRKGSVLLTLEMDEIEAEILIIAVKTGKLKDLGINDAKLTRFVPNIEKNNGSLKELDVRELKALIGQAKTKEVISRLKKIVKHESSDYNQIILLESRFNSILIKRRTIGENSEMDLEENAIRAGILELISSLKES